MSYTDYINYQETCNYINPEKDNAISMLKTCINDPNYKSPKKDLNPSDFCHSKPVENIDYKYGDNYPLEKLKNNKNDAKDSKSHINSVQHDLIHYLSNDNKKYIVDLNNDNGVNFDSYWDPNGLQTHKVDFRESKPNGNQI